MDIVALRQSLSVGATVAFGALALIPIFAFAEARVRWFALGSPGDYALLALGGIGMVAIVAAAVRLSGWTFRNYVAITPPSLHHMAIGMLGQIAVSPIFATAARLGTQPNLIAQMSPATFDYSTYFPAIVAFWIAAVLISPVCEEIFWRGFLYRGLAASSLGPFYTVTGTAVVFMLLHFADGAGGRAWHLACGILYGALRWYTGSLAAPVAAHIFGNGVAASLYTFGSWD